MTYPLYHISKFVLWVSFRLGFGLEIRGQEHVPRRGGCLIAANHTSFLDPPLIGATSPRRVSFMARATLFDQPLLGWYMRHVGVFPVVRGEGDLAAIREAVRRLRHGDVVALFPEGGRQPSGQLGLAKRGIGLLAVTAQVPIVPALITGTFQAWPPGAKRLRRAKIRIAFGEAISYTISSVPSAQRHEALAEAVTQRWQYLSGHRT